MLIFGRDAISKFGVDRTSRGLSWLLEAGNPIAGCHVVGIHVNGDRTPISRQWVGSKCSIVPLCGPDRATKEASSMALSRQATIPFISWPLGLAHEASENEGFNRLW